MVPLTIDESTETKNKTWPQYLASLSALIATFCAGVHFGWPSPSLPKILSNEEYEFEITKEEASYVAVIGPVGDIFGCVIFSLLVDVIGRKPTIILIAIPQICSMLMIYFSWSTKVLLYVGRFTGGLSEGACFTILPIYICEVSEPRIRGLLGTYFSVALISGMFVVNLVGTLCTIRTTALIFAAVPLIFLVIFSKMPESPYFYVMKKRIEDARDALVKLRHNRNVGQELTTLIGDVDRQMSEKGRYKDLILVETNRIAVILMLVVRLIQQFSGISAFTVYAQILFGQVTDAIPESWIVSFVLLLQAGLTTLTVAFVDRTGRKPLLLLSTFGCFASLAVEAIFFGFQDYTDVDLTSWNLVPLIGMMVYIVVFSLGLGSVVNLLMGEFFSASIKAKAQCCMTIGLAVGFFVSTKFYQLMADNYGLSFPFGVFALCQLAGFVFCLRYLPETKGKTLEQIQQELKTNKLVVSKKHVEGC